jgi:hypothetical protein
VDAADYVMWRDGTGGDPGEAGYNLWRENFGNGAPGAGGLAAAAVPEPTGLGLIVAATAVSAVSARRRRS